MNYDEWAAIGHANAWLGVRANNGATSKAGAKSLTVRAGSQRDKLLSTNNAQDYLSDDYAGHASGLASLPMCCYWKRCSELRQAGYIKPNGKTRISSAGVEQQVCHITAEGIQVLAAIS